MTRLFHVNMIKSADQKFCRSRNDSVRSLHCLFILRDLKDCHHVVDFLNKARECCTRLNFKNTFK